MQENVKPYRIIAKVKNNRLWKAITEIWPEVKTQTDAGKKVGWSNSKIGILLNMRKLPGHVKNGEILWWPRVVKLSEFLGYTPEYLFNPRLYNLGNLIPRKIELEVGISELERSDIKRLPPSAEEVSESTFMKEALNKQLATLSPREEHVLKIRYGIGDNKEHTYEEVGKEFSICKERARQTEHRTFRKLRHPKRSKGLKDFVRPQDADISGLCRRK